MKNLFILPATFLLSVVVANAQGNTPDIIKAKAEIKESKIEKREAKKELRGIDGDEPGVMVMDHFYEDFGNIDPAWKRTKFFDEASFISDGKLTVAYYNSDATLVGTTTPATFAELPASAQSSIKKQYKGFESGKVILFRDNTEDASDMMLYGKTFSSGDNYFVELAKAGKTVIVQVGMDGLVSFFSEKAK
ncbi:hypothetical protein LZZ85_27445 [Terrimonas sp. NA20]|uniref:Beta-lactamase-inhibitor-like PepSY-like domain-containing protein n=1 Tax=Terrimonas ginsenosidimutans TaxID=2908004 RepID=A0ABS9L0T1_9BACT|nr:hypothetical protein [Terrimonas ginsenosidimutans]MCG2618069.1 hypothetical protein [Terrimonas ginsenosidimutans]